MQTRVSDTGGEMVWSSGAQRLVDRRMIGDGLPRPAGEVVEYGQDFLLEKVGETLVWHFTVANVAGSLRLEGMDVGALTPLAQKAIARTLKAMGLGARAPVSVAPQLQADSPTPPPPRPSRLVAALVAGLLALGWLGMLALAIH